VLLALLIDSERAFKKAKDPFLDEFFKKFEVNN